jgi:hypothetical protein
MDTGLPAQKSARQRSRANGQHGGRAPLRKNFRDRILRYICNAVADGETALAQPA